MKLWWSQPEQQIIDGTVILLVGDHEMEEEREDMTLSPIHVDMTLCFCLKITLLKQIIFIFCAKFSFDIIVTNS